MASHALSLTPSLSYVTLRMSLFPSLLTYTPIFFLFELIASYMLWPQEPNYPSLDT